MNKDDAKEWTEALGQSCSGSWRQIQLAQRLGVPKALGLSTPEWVKSIGGYVRLSIEDRRAVVANATAEGHSTREIEEFTGVDHSTIARDVANATAAEKATATRTAHEEIAKFAFDQPATKVPNGESIQLGDFYELTASLKDNSVDLIFTDPPYDDKSIPLFDRMGEVAARVLKPGGSLVTYCGHMQLLKAGNALSKHLRFWQPLCCLHSGPAARLTEFGVVARFKPMLWFVRGTRSDKHTFIENVVTGQREKDHHEWQQAEAEAAYFIEMLSPAAGLVVDFFAGGGTTVVAATRLGRSAIGYEKNAEHHAAACKRLAA